MSHILNFALSLACKSKLMDRPSSEFVACNGLACVWNRICKLFFRVLRHFQCENREATKVKL